MRDLSVIIPARNELFLRQTIDDVLANIEADTEVIAICDGNWPEPPVLDHPRVTIVKHTVPIGQRAATNEGARISQAKYIAKLDAHCAVGKGFDRILMEDCQRDWCMVPMMWNLHAFDWQCKGCGERTYQGFKPTSCKCGATDFEMVIVWKPRGNKVTTSWRFDKNMQFQYWKKHAKRPEAQQDLVETMSFIGACFLMDRERFWEIEGLDETHGSWGQFGTEVSCKSWLSGGKVVTSKKTWFGHMFRTGNFKGAFGSNGSFPYPLSQEAVDKARAYSQDLWLNDKWHKATRPLSWLVDHFAPVPDWSE
jgi:glycosyltransferase involved in cell wall biosynthesis